MKDSRKTEKPLAKCSPDTKESHFSIVTGDEKWIYFENPKRKRSWVTPREPSTSTARPNRYGRKTILCVWWDQKSVIYYELLKSGETVNTEHYRQQMINLNQALYEKRPEYQKWQHKVILLHDNTSSHTTKLVKETIEALFGKYFHMRLTHQTWLRPIITYLHRWDTHLLSSFTSYQDVRKWLDDWFDSKEQQFFWRGIHKLSNMWKKCIATDGQYFK